MRIAVVRFGVLCLCAGKYDIVFVDKEKLANRYSRDRVYKLCNTGIRGIQDISYFLQYLKN